MNKNKFKLISLIIAILLIICLCSCSDSEAGDNSVNSANSLIVEVDGKTFTIEEAEGKTIEQLLKDAKISLKDGDVLSIDTDVELADSMVVKVLRKAVVTIEDTIKDIEYRVVLTGATVSDALSAAGIKLDDNHTTNYKADEALKDGMNIIVSERTEPETTEPHTDESEDNNDYDYNYNSNSGYTPPAPVVTNPPVTNPPQTTKPEVTKAPTTKPAEPTTSGRTIVSVEIYEDCDGSGHGVKVITYSDGTQEEVAF